MKIKVVEGAQLHNFSFTDGESILEVLQREGIRTIHAPCGGRGTCKKCVINVHSNAFNGTCLACTTKAEDGMLVEVCPTVRISFADHMEANLFPPTPGQTGYAISADIGTTTIVCCLMDLAEGKAVASVSGSNEQSIFGANVIARLQAASEGHAETLHELVIAQTNRYIQSLCSTASISSDDISFMAVSGNTIMEHFFAGIDPSTNGIAPFVPVSLFGETLDAGELGLCFSGNVYLCPAVSGTIGGDTIAAMLSCCMQESDICTLMADIGANCELVLGCGDRFVACSADAGGAFKTSLNDFGMTASAGAVDRVKWDGEKLQLRVLGGKRAKGICGSGMIDALSIMVRLGILDGMGHIAEADEVDGPIADYLGAVNGKPAFFLDSDHTLYISQADISRFQLSKAAIHAGITILSEEYGIGADEIDRVFLSGGLGSFTKSSYSTDVGLIPSELAGRVQRHGNATLQGTTSAAISAEAREKMNYLRTCVRTVDLPTHPSFSDAYVDGMMFEEAE